MNEFDKDYFENGIVSGKSCYFNYHWMPELTIKMAFNILKDLGLKSEERVVDFGCAKGYLVKALRILDIPTFGCDISKYAISQADLEVRDFCKLIESDDRLIPFDDHFDWLITKDVMEHMREDQVDNLLKQAATKCSKMFHVIPLGDGQNYIIPEYGLDKTHILAKTREWWEDKFKQFGWKVDSFSYKMPGVKDNWTSKYEFGNGFFVLSR